MTFLITGVTGQDGTLLTELLLSKGHEVIGSARKRDMKRIRSEVIRNSEKFSLIELVLNNREGIEKIIKTQKLKAIFHLASFSTGSGMFHNPHEMVPVNSLSTLYFIDAIRKYSPQTRFIFASSSEIFANSKTSPQTENSPTAPRSPYGATKLFSQNLISIWRQKYDLSLSSVILYNHESELRSEKFVSKKIVCDAVDIYQGIKKEFFIGDINAQRDWGYARDYVHAMNIVCQKGSSDDYIIATGKSRSVKELCNVVFSHLGLDYRNYLKFDANLMRKPDQTILVGDTTKINNDLGWSPSTSFDEWTRYIVAHELNSRLQGNQV